MITKLIKSELRLAALFRSIGQPKQAKYHARQAASAILKQGKQANK